jgi:hypothetical protein
VRKIYLGFALMTIFLNAFAATQHQAKGFIWSGEGNKCWFKQNDTSKSFYFSKNKENYNSSISIISFDDSNCMVKDSMGMENDLNKMMINTRISGWYSHSDADFGTKVGELYDTSYNQGKGKCMQSKKYKGVAVAIDYIVNDKGSITSVRHATTSSCFNNKVSKAKNEEDDAQQNLNKHRDNQKEEPEAPNNSYVLSSGEWKCNTGFKKIGNECLLSKVSLVNSEITISKLEKSPSSDLWNDEEVAKKIEFDDFLAKQKSIKIELNTINSKIKELRAKNKTKVERLIVSLEGSNQELLEAANKAQDERSIFNSSKENLEIYSKYLGSNKIARSALLFYKEMTILSRKMEAYGDSLSLKDAEIILLRAALGKATNDGNLAKAILMDALGRDDLIIVANDYLNTKF